MICPKCGANITDKGAFCGKCGCEISTYVTDDNINNAQVKPKFNENSLPEDKNKIKKIAIICTIAVVVVVSGGIGLYQYNKIKTYNDLISTANKNIEQGEYDQAIALFNQSLQYKNDPDIQKSIKSATELKEIKSVFDEGTKLMNDKKYLEAIEHFEKITKEDYQLYNNAQSNIEECKKQFIPKNIQLANDAVKNNKNDDANRYLNEVLQVDPNNTDAKKIKDDIAEATKRDSKQNTQNNTMVVIIRDQPRPDVYYGNFIFWNSDRVYLSKSQVYSLTDYQLGIARNEIFARHGYIFSMEKYRSYFNAQSWYTPFTRDVTLNSVEQYNVSLIKAEENRRGVVN